MLVYVNGVDVTIFQSLFIIFYHFYDQWTHPAPALSSYLGSHWTNLVEVGL